MTHYIVVSTFTFFFLFAIWSKTSPLNLLLKLGWLSMAIWGCFLCLLSMGYLVKQ